MDVHSKVHYSQGFRIYDNVRDPAILYIQSIIEALGVGSILKDTFRKFLLIISNGDVRTAGYMSIDHSSEIKISCNICVRHHNILFFLRSQKIKNISQRIHMPHVQFGFSLCIWRQYIQSAVFSHQIPFAPGIEMIHQRMVILLHQNRNIGDAAV